MVEVLTREKIQKDLDDLRIGDVYRNLSDQEFADKTYEKDINQLYDLDEDQFYKSLNVTPFQGYSEEQDPLLEMEEEIPVEPYSVDADPLGEMEEKKVSVIDKVAETVGSYFEQAQRGRQLADEGVGRIAGKAATEIATFPIEATKTVAALTSDELFNKLQKSELNKSYENFKKNLNPNITENEKIAGELLTYVIGGLGVTKVIKELVEKVCKKRADKLAKIVDELGDTKVIRKKDSVTKIETSTPKLPSKLEKRIAKTAGLAGGGATVVQLDVQMAEEDDPLMSEFITNIETLSKEEGAIGSVAQTLEPFLKDSVIMDAAKTLVDSPNDTEAQKRIRRLKDAIGFNLALSGIAAGLLTTAKYGVKGTVSLSNRLKNKAKQLNNAEKSGELDVPPPTENDVVINSKVSETKEGNIVKKDTVREKLVRILPDLKTGRLLRSDGSLPKEYVDLINERFNADKGFKIEIKAEVKKLERLQKEEGISSEALSNAINKNDISGLDNSPKTLEQVSNIKSLIQNNENKINDFLGLEGESRIGFGRAVDGTVYFTRTFEANNNVGYVNKIRKTVDELAKRRELGEDYIPKVDAEFIARVQNARNYFLKQGIAEQDVDEYVKLLVKKLGGSEKNIVESFFEPVGQGFSASQGAIKVLKERKDLDKNVLELLGEETDPYKKIAVTLQQQNKLLSELNYLTEVDKLARAGIDKDVPLKSFVPGLSTKTTFSARETDQLDYNLEQIVKNSIGRFGGDNKKLLNNVFASKEVGELLNAGLDIGNNKGKGLQNFLGRAAALAQAKETILDAPAYLLNLYGAGQGLILNGMMLKPRAYKAAVTELKTLAEQIRLKDPKAVKKLATLRRLGVLEQDVTGEMISRNANLFGDTPKNAFAREYGRIMQKFGSAYGQPDAYAKLIAFEAEYADIKKYFPKLSDDEAIRRAATYVKDTMPTYGEAAPLARVISRTPFLGNYVLFPSEVLRTTKNILKYTFLKDLPDAFRKGKTKAQRAYHLKRFTERLVGLGSIGAGAEYMVSSNNEANGIGSNERKVLNSVAPDFGKGSANLFLDGGFVLDEIGEGLTPEQKENYVPQIRGRFVGSSSAHAYDYIMAPVRLITARVLGAKNPLAVDISETDIDNAFSDAAKLLTNSFTSPKFAAKHLINALTGRDEQGRSILDEGVGATTAENVKRRALEFLKGYQGGSVKLVRDYILAADAEELLGEGLGMRASGFPMTKKDALFSLSGIRSQTVLPEKCLCYKTFNDLKAIGEVDSMFYDELRKLPIKQITPEDIDNIVDRYKELQLRKVKGLSDFNKNIDLYSKFSYTRKFLNKNNKPDTEKLTLGTAGVLKAVTNNYAYNTAPEVERAFANQALQDSKQELFVPKDIDTDKLQKFVQERSNDVGIVGDLIVKLQNVNKELINTTLNPKGEE